jgi:hypothetical protein
MDDINCGLDPPCIEKAGVPNKIDFHEGPVLTVLHQLLEDTRPTLALTATTPEMILNCRRGCRGLRLT